MKIRVLSLFALTFLIIGATGASAAMDLSRLLVYWPCDDSGDMMTDASGNGWDATIGSGSWVDGKYGGGLQLQSSNTEVQGDIISSTADTGEITLACWFIMDEHASYDGLISIEAAAAGCCEYRLMVNPNSAPFWDMGHHADKNLDGVFTFDTGTWYHYAITGDGDVGKVYVDGEYIGEQAEGFDLPEFVDVTIYVGTGESPGTHSVEDATFDEITIWDKALTEDEIKELMAGGFTAVEPTAKLPTTWAGIKSN